MLAFSRELHRVVGNKTIFVPTIREISVRILPISITEKFLYSVSAGAIEVIVNQKASQEQEHLSFAPFNNSPLWNS